MQFTLSLATLIAVAAAAQEFSVILSGSGTQVHLSQLAIQDSQYWSTYGLPITSLTLNDDGSLYDNNSKNYIQIQDGKLVPAYEEPATKFEIQDGSLVVKGSTSGFTACPDKDNHFAITTDETCENAAPFHFLVQDVKESEGTGPVSEGPHVGYIPTANNTNPEIVTEQSGVVTTTIPCHVCEGGSTVTTVPVPTGEQPPVVEQSNNAGIKGVAAAAAAVAAAAFIL